MITKTLTYWQMTQLVKEYIDPKGVESFMALHFSKDWEYVTFKTSKDEVLQMYNDDICYAIIGGSSADKYEWRGNFTFGRFRNLFKRKKLVLAKGLMHYDYHKSAIEVMSHESFIERPEMVFPCHSRGGGVGKCISFETGWLCIAFGAPKVFSKWADVNVINVLNKLDIVGWVVPFFKRCGKTIWYKFRGHVHTGYGEHITDNSNIFTGSK